MEKLVKHVCQKMGNNILIKMEQAKTVAEVNHYFDLGMMLNYWCLSQGIELE
jgi:hypothetical protein